MKLRSGSLCSRFIIRKIKSLDEEMILLRLRRSCIASIVQVKVAKISRTRVINDLERLEFFLAQHFAFN